MRAMLPIQAEHRLVPSGMDGVGWMGRVAAARGYMPPIPLPIIMQRHQDPCC